MVLRAIRPASFSGRVRVSGQSGVPESFRGCARTPGPASSDSALRRRTIPGLQVLEPLPPPPSFVLRPPLSTLRRPSHARLECPPMDRIRNTRRTILICVLLAAATLAVYWPVVHYQFVNLDDPALRHPKRPCPDRLDLGQCPGRFPRRLRQQLASAHLALAYPRRAALRHERRRTPSHQRGVSCPEYHPALSCAEEDDQSGAGSGKPEAEARASKAPSPLRSAGALHSVGDTTWRCAFVAALFALHPLHVESVAWVSERKDVLSAFFFFLTLYAYTRYAEIRSPKSEIRKPTANSEIAAKRREKTQKVRKKNFSFAPFALFRG